MSLIQANGLSKSFGANDIFGDLSLSIPQRARIGLVGANGVGKTTLVRILLGLEEPSAGEVQRARGLRMGYLPQQAHLDSPLTLWQECRTVFDELLALQDELRRMEGQLSQQPELLETYGRLQETFERRGGYTYEVRIRQTLTGLGFSTHDFERPLMQLSGGQRTRAALARLLLGEHDVLFLDEPTNHLDTSAVEWLEAYLADWPGAALIISHDRYFLDRVVGEIWEMTPMLETYRGNYTAYLAQRAERYARRIEEYEAQRALVEKEQDYIRRNLAGQNSRQAQGRRKRLDRMLAEAQQTPPPQPRRLHLRLEPVSRSGDLVLQTHGLVVGYEVQQPLFEVPDLVLRRGECAAIWGPNGAGKTTFLKTLLGQVPPLRGELSLGAGLKIGYFAQAHESLNPAHSLLEEILATAPQLTPAEGRALLARFLFSGEDVFQSVQSLSGGERSRLALACLSLQGANLLLLDEPTNHLDLPAQETLQAMLAEYRGTILLVSHDRYLLDALATQIWEVRPHARQLRIFEGTYSEYRQALESAAAVLPSSAAAPVRPATPSVRPAGKTNKERQRIAQRQALEAQISAQEAELARLSGLLEHPPADAARVLALSQAYQQAQQALEQSLEAWMQLAEETSDEHP
ncbi:MAG: ATP-binding cassette domain-containing protein [Anaerolinea sp.]|nr:ATP-binding cassette domain-containing protein [Anaerolinea sp.]